jgi:hypothetical protein
VRSSSGTSRARQLRTLTKRAGERAWTQLARLCAYTRALGSACSPLAGKGQREAAHWSSRAQETGLALDTACDYLRLPTQLRRAHAAVQPLLAAGRRRLLASFDDLGCVWGADEGQRDFVGLPLEAVQARPRPCLRRRRCAPAEPGQALPPSAAAFPHLRTARSRVPRLWLPIVEAGASPFTREVGVSTSG